MLLILPQVALKFQRILKVKLNLEMFGSDIQVGKMNGFSKDLTLQLIRMNQ